MGRKKLEIDTSGDDKRYIKFRDMDLYRVSKGFWPFRSIWYEAVHRTTRIKSSRAWFASERPNWALADCIYQVIRERGLTV